MNFKREDLIDHLKRISCGGRIKQVIFSGAFQAAALTPDQLLLVVAPALDCDEELAAPIGVADLDLFVKALEMMPGSEEDIGVDITVEDHRLVINETGRGSVRLLTAQPRTIETRVEQEIVDTLMKQVGGVMVPLTESLIASIKRAFAGLQATSVEIVAGLLAGHVRVGDDTSHFAEFPLPDLRSPDGEYRLNFGQHLINVLSTVDTDATMYLGGAQKPVVVQDGEYNYLLSPRATGSAEKKAGGKGKGKGKKPDVSVS